MWPRVVPFGLYMAFVAVGEGLRGWWPGGHEELGLWLYPVKIAVVTAALLVWWKSYDELSGPWVQDWREGLYIVGVGLGVYGLWVHMDWAWAIQGEMQGYNPFLAGEPQGTVLAGFRFLGAVAVVPLMEEVFWRSFLIRWIIDTRFERVPLGTFSPLSFAVTVVLFGLEHNLWAAGMMAGAAYNLLLYRTRRLWPCVLAHALTNLALGAHVLATGEWRWW